MNTKVLNQDIRDSIMLTLKQTVRPIETRAYAKKLARRFHTNIFRVYGVLSGLTRSNAVHFTVKQRGGPSYIR